YGALHEAVVLADRYIVGRFMPDKAIDLIDESAAKVRLDEASDLSPVDQLQQQVNQAINQKEQAIEQQDFEKAADIRQKEMSLRKKLDELIAADPDASRRDVKVEAEDVAEVVSEWTGVPLTQLQKKESERLINLEQILQERVVGQ